MSRTVAIVGRPNVGKSRLFNRLTRKRISIVHDQPGVTRDVIAAEVEDGAYTLLDTGGIGLKGGESSAQIVAATEGQVQFAIDTAQVILFVVDAKDGVTALDERIAQRLRQKGKTVLLVVNKIDFHDGRRDNPDFYRLGLGEPYFHSAEHGVGEVELRDAILAKLGPAPEESADA
jgi:GTP-binding protein